MTGITLLLIGLGIMIGAFMPQTSTLYTNTKRNWIAFVGYLILFCGSVLIRHAFSEESREPFAIFLMIISFGTFVLSSIFLLPTSIQSKWAGSTCILSLGAMLVAAQLLPAPPPSTQEEQIEVLEELTSLTDDELWRHIIQQWGEIHRINAAIQCIHAVEPLAPYYVEWTVDVTDPQFFSKWVAYNPHAESDPFIPPFDASTILLYTGHQVRFQNDLGVFSTMTYLCHYHPETQSIIKVKLFPGNRYKDA